MLLYNVPGRGKLTLGTPFKLSRLIPVDEGSEPYLDEVSYPANWLEHASETDLAALGITTEPIPVEPAPPPTLDDYKDAIQSHVDAVARAHGYTDGNSCASYENDPVVPQWAAEATAFKAWRSTIWAYTYNQMYAVQNAQRSQPTIDELVAELPAIAWPEVTP